MDVVRLATALARPATNDASDDEMGAGATVIRLRPDEADGRKHLQLHRSPPIAFDSGHPGHVLKGGAPPGQSAGLE
jgi:hypothetical protein